MEAKSVFHGSPVEFDAETANPKRNIRSRMEDGKEVVIFDEESFHATPHRSIALAYTYNGKQTKTIDGKECYYNMGVSLYKYENRIAIYGFDSLEESLKVLYGNGGYVYHFDGGPFFWKEGLGNHEVIVKEATKPVRVERIEDPVEEMRKEGVEFDFFDLALPENAEKRSYK